MLLEGSRALGLPLTQAQADSLSWLAGELGRWSDRINLTAILDPIEMADKHILDSLTVLRALEVGTTTLLDAGAGAGFPGLPLAVARPDLSVTLVDAVAKKVGFLKHAIAQLRLAPRVRAIHLKLQGNPASEGLGSFDAAVSRALAEPSRWATLAAPYLRPGGTLIVMAGSEAEPRALPGWSPPRVDRLRLPLTGVGRTLLSYRKAAAADSADYLYWSGDPLRGPRLRPPDQFDATALISPTLRSVDPLRWTSAAAALTNLTATALTSPTLRSVDRRAGPRLRPP